MKTFNLYNNKSVKSNDQSFIEACKMGDLELIKHLLYSPEVKNKPHIVRFNPKTNAYDIFLEPINQSVINGQIKVISYLFSLPENAKLFQQHFILPLLYYATHHNQIEIFKFLLNYSYPFKFEEEDIKEHLLYAIKVDKPGCFELFKTIIKNSIVPINLIDNDYFYFKEMCEANANDLIHYVISELDLPFDKKIVKWLKGDNLHECEYEYPLTLLNSKKLHQKLNNKLSILSNINKKKIKL